MSNDEQKMAATWRGIRCEDLTVEQLREAFTAACKELDRMRKMQIQDAEMFSIFAGAKR